MNEPTTHAGGHILYLNISRPQASVGSDYCFTFRSLHNHGNIATEGGPKPGLCPSLISNEFKGS